MKIQLIAVGTKMPDWVTAGFTEYQRRFPKEMPLELIEIPAGKRGKYRPGAARLARELDIPLVPVAHNSGEFWPRNSFLKYPGEITVVIGPPIMPDGRGPEALTREVENWIEARQAEISGVGPFASAEDKARRAVAQPA